MNMLTNIVANLDEYATIAFMVLGLAVVLLKALGLSKWADKAIDVQEAVKPFREVFYRLRYNTPIVARQDLKSLSEKISVKTEIKAAVIETALDALTDSKTPDTQPLAPGLKIAIDRDGTVNVDPSGFIANKALKIKKWLRKI